MQEITYTITDPEGMHARPAGELVKAAAACACSVTVEKAGGRQVDAKRIMGVMGLCAKQGDQIVLRCEGEGEEEAMATLSSFIEQNL